MTRPSDHYPRRCGCGHHAADPAINDHPISLRDDLDALTVEADTPSRVGIGVEGVATPAPSTSDDYVSVSITLTGDRQLVELVAALVIGGVK